MGYFSMGRKMMFLLILFKVVGHILNILILDNFLSWQQMYGLNHNGLLIQYDKGFINYNKVVI